MKKKNRTHLRIPLFCVALTIAALAFLIPNNANSSLSSSSSSDSRIRKCMFPTFMPNHWQSYLLVSACYWTGTDPWEFQFIEVGCCTGTGDCYGLLCDVWNENCAVVIPSEKK